MVYRRETRHHLHFEFCFGSKPASGAHSTGVLILQMTNKQVAQIDRVQMDFQGTQADWLADERPAEKNRWPTLNSLALNARRAIEGYS